METLNQPANPCARIWSAYQQAIFRDVAEGQGHTVVAARAGSGKTSTIVEALSYVPQGLSVLLVAFNKSIATELQARTPRGVEVSTLHSFGLKACYRHFGKVRIDEHRVDALCTEMHGSERGSLGLRRSLAKAVSLAKGSLATTREHVDALIDRHEVDTGETSEDREAFISDVLTLLSWCKDFQGSIDFDDMIWLPVALGLKTRTFDRVFVDETQDLNPAQIALALKAINRGGRIVAVGDDRQAIYSFRGADKDAVGNVIAKLSARVLPLAVSYRCARAIVREAQTIVEDFEHAPDAPEGLVTEIDALAMMRDAKPGDFILSRANAPLISLCLAFLRSDRRATIQGRSIGESLMSFIERSRCDLHSLSGVSAFLVYVDTWCAAECKRLDAKGRDTTAATDKAETLTALCDGMGTLQETLARIDALFSDKGGEKIVLSSTHKAKGLERERVFLLSDTYMRRPGTEEENLYYVAVTRAKSELYLVAGIAGGKGGPKPEKVTRRASKAPGEGAQGRANAAPRAQGRANAAQGRGARKASKAPRGAMAPAAATVVQ